jgi:hypothetical protein
VNALQKTLAIIAFLVLATQTVQHAYVLWLEPRKSVLDKYDRPLKDEISKSTSLEELLGRYEAVHKAADQTRQERLKQGKAVVPGQLDDQGGPLTLESSLHDAIAEWENKSKEIRELRSYWFAGLLFLFGGLLSYRRLNRWFGLTLLIVAFSLFIYWTSGTSETFSWYAAHEFHKLMLNKLAFSAVSLLLLIWVIWLGGIFAEKKETPAK